QQSTPTPAPGQFQNLLALLNDAAKNPDVGSIMAAEGSFEKGFLKRWSNAATGELLFPTQLTYAEEKSFLSKLRSLYGGNDTFQNALDIETYNKKPVLGSEHITHSDLSDTAEITSLMAGILALVKHAPQLAAKIRQFGLDDLKQAHRAE